MKAAGAAASARPRIEWLPWLFALLALLYAGFVHHGLGPGPEGVELLWYEPRGFLWRWSWLAWALADTGRLMLVLGFPAAALAVACGVSGRAALPRALALSALVAVALFAFYGSAAARVWQFFLWRGSAVLAATALAVGFALAAPWLAQSWLRLRWPARLVLAVPAATGVVALLRNATGTDPALMMNLSPWPVVAVFGLEVGALLVMSWLAGVAGGLAGLARGLAARGRARGPWVAAGLGLALALPAAVLTAEARGGLLPFRADARSLGWVATASAAGLVAAALWPPRGAPALADRSRRLAAGAALITAPLLTGQLWARFDYYWTREHRARQLIEAIDRYYARESLYPDELEDLVAAGDLERIPEPAIGFAALYDGEFGYRSFGTSYLIEFPATRWVECAYTPPYADEADGDEIGGGEMLEEAWSCPARPPELW